MNDTEDFEDWSHPTRPALHIPRARVRIRWGYVGIVLALISFWLIVYAIGTAAR